jgi:putrescine transport system substrate-binding protein
MPKHGEREMSHNVSLAVKLALSLGIMFGAANAAFGQGMVSAPDSDQLSEQYAGLAQAPEQEIVTMQRLLRRLGYLKTEQLSRKMDEPTTEALDAHFAAVGKAIQSVNASKAIRSLFAEAWTKEGWGSGNVDGQDLVVDKDKVQAAQQALKTLGYEPGPTDGVFGPATFAAIESFQEDAGMKVRGLLTQDMDHNISRTLKFADKPPVAMVHMFNWTTYINPDTLDKFETETGIRVAYDTYTSSSESKELLLSGSDQYDVVVQTGSQMRLVLEGNNPILKLDRSKIPNAADIDPRVRTASDVLDPGNLHSEPYMWGTMGLAVNVDKVRALLPDAKIDSTALIMDPKIAAKLAKCGLSVNDEPLDVMPTLIAYLGGDIKNIGIADIEAVDAALGKVSQYVTRVPDEGWTESMTSGKYCVSIGFPGATFRAAEAAKKNGVGQIIYSVPREGTSMWLDYFVIPSNAKDKDAAYKLIDFMLRPDIAAANTNFLRYANPVLTSAQYIDPALLKNKGLYPPPATLKKVSATAPISPDEEKLLKAAWEKLPKQ